MEKSKTRGKREGSRTLPDSTGARKEGRMKDWRVVRLRGESTRLRCTQRKVESTRQLIKKTKLIINNFFKKKLQQLTLRKREVVY